ncbi:MAG: alginate export family protein [Candidatus Omnitrophica bacterium]|nr:alginate export family protein [Candidatus Omnitrophota bacterium]MDD5430423.1 alginate export family protein [Candidatus Omnitrophota bacterium]
MSRKLVFFLVVFFFCFSAAAFAAVENIKVSGDIGEQYFARGLTLGQSYNGSNSHQGVFSQIRLRFDADLTEGVSATVRLLNERLWNAEDSNDDKESLNLDLGYIELKEFFYQPLTLIVGRQNLRYGNAMIVGDPDTNQTAAGETPSIVSDLSWKKSFDSIRAILDFSPYTIDVIYARLKENETGYRDEQNLYGVNVAYDWAMGNGAVTEGYFFGTDNSDSTGTWTDKKDRVYALGARTLFHLSENFTLGTEGAYQFGRRAVSATSHQSRRAYAGQFISEYRFNNKYDAKIGIDYSFFSGDKPNSDRYEAWDPMYEDQTPAELMNVLLTQSNRQLIGFTASMVPVEDVILKVRYARGWCVKGFTSSIIQVAAGPAAGNVYYVNVGKKFLGDEIDISANYDYTEDIKFSLSGACLLPGKVFTGENNHPAYSVRGGVVVNF